VQNCTECKKRFTVTSWTKDRVVRAICPPCINKIVLDFLSKKSKEG
jgi:hypothetical protein